MRLKSSKGAEIVSVYGQKYEVKEMRLNGQTIWPFYSLELSVSSVTIPATGDGSTVDVYGVARNEDGTEISRQLLTYPEVTITKTGSSDIKQSVFTFYADNRGTTPGAARSATYTFTWKGQSVQLVVTQAANVETLTGVSRYFRVGSDDYPVGDKVTFSSAAQSVALSCRYINHYSYTTGQTKDETLNGAIYAVQGTGFSFANNVLTIAENTGASARTATITGRFPGPTAEYTLTAEQEKPAIVVYDVRWTAYNMRQVGGKKAFTFAITYNSNLTGAILDFVAYKMNNGVRTDIAFLRGVTMTGTSYTYSGADFANNDSTASGDKYYIEFSYGGQTFTSPDLANQYYLANASAAYSGGVSYIKADGSNYAYVTADLMLGGTIQQRDVVCNVTSLTATGLNITNGRVYGSNRGTTEGSAIAGRVNTVTYGSYSLAVSISVSQQANVLTTGSPVGALTLNGLTYGGSASISVTAASHAYDAFATAYRTDSYTSGATKRVDLTASLQATGTGFSLSGNTLNITENTGEARTGTLKLNVSSSTLITLTITQAKAVPVYTMTMSAVYRMIRARMTFDISATYSDGLRGQTVRFQPYRMYNGVRTDIGTGQLASMPSTGNTANVVIATSSAITAGADYYVEASYGGSVIATCSAYQEI